VTTEVVIPAQATTEAENSVVAVTSQERVFMPP